MKILLIIDNMTTIGGVERVVLNLSNAFLESNHLLEFKNIIGEFKPDFIIDNSYFYVPYNCLFNQKAIKVIHGKFDIYKDVKLKYENIILLLS